MARGGKRPGAGRKKGAINKVGADLRELAQTYTQSAVAELARIALEGSTDQARVSAIKELLDRGHGKATQSLEHAGPGGSPLAPPVFAVTFGNPDDEGDE